MASIEELLSMALGAGQAQVAKDDPYLGLQKTGMDIGSLFQQATTNPKLMEGNGTRDAILGAAISGLFGGAMGSLSSGYQADRTSKYNDLLLGAMGGQDVSGNKDVTGALAQTAQNQANQFKAYQSFRNQDDERQAKNAIAQQAGSQLAARSPNNAKNLLKQILGVDVPQEQPMAIKREGNRGAEGAMLDEISNEAQLLMQSGATPGEAFQTARTMYSSRKDELQKSYAKVDEASDKGRNLMRMTDLLEQSVDRAGATGFMGTGKQWTAGLLGELGVDSQEQKYSAGDEIKSLGADIVREARQIGSGPMSDKDVQMYLGSGPNLTNSPDANKAILSRMRTAAKLQSTYADFMRSQREVGTPVYKAESKWAEIVDQNPYFIRDQGGKLVPNPTWESNLLDASRGDNAATFEFGQPSNFEAISPTQASQGNIKVAPDGKRILIQD